MAKVLELADLQILNMTSLISGHSLKHIAAAVACFYVIAWLKTINVGTRLTQDSNQ
ncbi:hypothetical protein [Psychrobium sp. 1_MG-2023]|uniref:hypothetical protein n=1 Tax=Psychrobium sp. 1_MG-2023 TaxID=3062624 RepID=UPI00273466A7|nr:hypothetical protein [Psychrobium sp. 1_MG-2023]MDP2562568.1 hypothetical protein [Psychrobium sp. 1_MG-2023]